MPLTPASLLTIDLDAVRANYRQLRVRVGPQVAVAGVVKADAYGLGLVPVAQALEQENCPAYFVAQLAEGVALRALTHAPIAVFNGPLSAEELRDYAAHNLIPVLNSMPQIERALAQEFRGPVMLHLDTGMNRLGLSAADCAHVAEHPNKFLRPLNLSLILSHYACADEAGHPLTAQQTARFAQLHAQLCRSMGAPIAASLANSSGIFRDPAAHHDMVRPGMSLYGLNPTPEGENPMAPVVTLQAPIVQIRDAPAGETVGYGATGLLKRASRLATLPIGYADGLPRSLSNRGQVVIGDHPCPIIGRVSMDSLTLDITDYPGHLPPPQPGDWAEIIGPHQPADALATQAGTIGYEILTQLSRRAERRYLGAIQA